MKTAWIKMTTLLVAAMLAATALTSCTNGKKNEESETTTEATTTAPTTSTSNAAVRNRSAFRQFPKRFVANAKEFGSFAKIIDLDYLPTFGQCEAFSFVSFEFVFKLSITVSHQ